MPNHRSRTARTAAITGLAAGSALLLTACNSVPGEPMSAEELETVVPTGDRIPEGWQDVEAPSAGETDAGAESLLFRMGMMFSDIDTGDECEDQLEEFEDNLEEVELVAQGEAPYSDDDAEDYFVAIPFSTDDESDVTDEALELMRVCYESAAEEDEDLEGAELGELDTTLDSVLVTVRDADEEGILLIGGYSYGQNHLLVMGFSDDPDADFSQIADATHEVFEEGPDAD